MKCSNLTPINSSICWDGHSFGQSSRAFTVSLSTDASECLSFFIRGESLSQAETKTFTTAIAQIITQHVFEGRGFALIRLPWYDQMSCDALIAATMAIAASVGKIAAQDEMGTKVVHVRDTGRSMAEGARYHETNASGGLHTDGPQLSKPPDLLFTACFRRAKYGGDSLLASAATLHNRLMQEGRDMLAVLHDSFHFDRRGFGNLHNPTLERPIFICSRSHFSFRYLYEYILDGHSKAKVPLSNLQRDAIETLRGMLEEDDVVLRVRVNPGELLITNNHRVCHGRTSFQDDSAQGTVRHLIRVWANV